MSRKKNKGSSRTFVPLPPKQKNSEELKLRPDTKKSVWAVVFFGIAAVLVLASFKNAGPLGNFLFRIFEGFFGLGYYLLPLIFLIIAGVFLASERRRIHKTAFLGAVFFVLAGLGLIDIVFPDRAGLIGNFVGFLEIPFGYIASLVIVSVVVIIAFLITLDLPIKIKKREKAAEAPEPLKVSEPMTAPVAAEEKTEEIQRKISEKIIERPRSEKTALPKTFKNYIAPPLDLLKSSIEKPTSGDIRANANIIKRTLENFGIPVEMGEINIGPKVTRYTLKPAEGVKISRIITLNQDLALALAAHPIRIEAPIPGKSLVGIEVPNKASALVRLGNLMAYPEFSGSGPIGFVLGRDVNGEPIFADIDKMPHLLIAGTTGSGKTCAADTYVFSEKGILTFEELCPLPLNLEKEFKIKIATRDGIEETSKNYNNGICDFYKIETKEGYAIEVTAEHPLWVLDDFGKMKWQAGINIKEGDYVAIARETKIFGQDLELNFRPSKDKTNKSISIKIPDKMTPELGLFLGFLTADGGITIKNKIVYTQADKYLLDLYQQLLKKLFGILSFAVTKSGKSNKAKDVIVHSKQLWEFLFYLGMKPVKSPKKEVPKFIRMAGPDTIKSYLRGLMRNDGHLNQNTLQLCVASKILVKQIQLILLNFGIISSFQPKKVKAYPQNTYWRLSIYGNELVKYQEIINFLTKKEQNKIIHHLSLHRNPNNNIIPNISALLKNLKLTYRNVFAKITNNSWQYKAGILMPKYAFANLISYNNGDRRPSYYALEKILKFYQPIANTKEYNRLKEIHQKNFYWAKIKSISKTKGEGYDFEVPGSNSFVGNGFINHNSIAIHSLLISLLYKNSPQTLRLILIDPKRVELSIYNNLPHLVSPVIINPKKAMAVFRWTIQEMDRRYELLLKAGSRDIQSYNKKKPEEFLPYILIVVDELADLMFSYGREIEGSIIRLTQMSRATGIHLILSTQRPSVEVVTGLIKANITTRIALQLPSQVDSRTILDTSGAEKLLGGGDMLYISSESSKPKRIQGAYITEEEVKKVADFIRENNDGFWEKEGMSVAEGISSGFENGDSSCLWRGSPDEVANGAISEEALEKYSGDEEDELFNEAIRVVSEAKKASASLLQRRLKIGYARAARLLDIMEDRGIIGPGEGAKPREVYMDKV